MRRSTTRLIALVVLALLFASPVAVVAGQATPTPGRDSALLATAPFDLPPAPTPIVLARISFATGSGLSMNANPGPAMHFVESGGFEVLAGGPMTLYRTPEDISAISGEEVASGTTFTIGPGDLLVIPANSPFEVFNVQQEPAIALIVELFSRPEGTVFPDGIALELLVAGVADQLPPGPTHTFIRRDAFAPDVAFPQSPSGELGRAVVDGPTLVYVESGTLEYTIFSGEVQITRSAPTATPRSTDGSLSAPPSINVSVAEGDAMFQQMSTEYILRNVGEEPAVVLALGFSDADVGPYATPGAGL
jgi:hypothetical protein